MFFEVLLLNPRRKYSNRKAPTLSLIKKAPRIQDFLGNELLPGDLGSRFPCDDVLCEP
jgi:hypothetical protein